MTTAELTNKTFVPTELILRDHDHNPLPTEKIKEVIANALLTLQSRFERHFSASPITYVGITIEKAGKQIRLVPSVNGMGKNALKSEFTSIVKQQSEIAVARHPKSKPIEAAPATDECLSILAEHATLKVESVGARETNWDTGYTIEINSLPTDEIREILNSHMSLTNSDKRNECRDSGFTLTTRSECQKFMELCGKGKAFNEAVTQVKRFEDEHALKSLQDANNGKFPDWKEKSLTITLKLDTVIA